MRRLSSSSPSLALAGSRAPCFLRPKSAQSARAISIFLYLFLSLLDIFGSERLFNDFLCNHKHIQSFVNSVLIIAKALSLSFSCALVYYWGISEREKERKRKRDTIILFFFFWGKKRRFDKKKEKDENFEKTLTTRDDTKSSSLFLFLFRSNEEHHHLENSEKRSIKRGSER